VFTTDFCYGYIVTPTLSLQFPGGISFDMMHYWDGQPVRFTCCERKREGDNGAEDSDTPWGCVLWCVVIELVLKLLPVVDSAFCLNLGRTHPKKLSFTVAVLGTKVEKAIGG
jgi:Protein of unknown function (DUF1769)